MIGMSTRTLKPSKEYVKYFEVKSMKFFFEFVTEFSEAFRSFLFWLRARQRAEKEMYFPRNSVKPAMARPRKVLAAKW
jgi:hypothetical protein